MSLSAIASSWFNLSSLLNGVLLGFVSSDFCLGVVLTIAVSCSAIALSFLLGTSAKWTMVVLDGSTVCVRLSISSSFGLMTLACALSSSIVCENIELSNIGMIYPSKIANRDWTFKTPNATWPYVILLRRLKLWHLVKLVQRTHKR